MKKGETFDEWFDRVYGWYKKNRGEPPHIDKHSEKISYDKVEEDKHIIKHVPHRDEHVIEHGHDHHDVPEMDSLPEADEEKSLQEWVDRIHKLWEEHS